jgi:hypothetical protein
MYVYALNNPLIYTDPTGHWNQKLGLNYLINEYKNQWAIAPTKVERDYWAQKAEDLRRQIRQSRPYKKRFYVESDIMKRTDAMIPMEEIMKKAHEMFPVLSAIQGFTEDAALYLETNPGEGFAITTGNILKGSSKISKLKNGLNFTATAASRMRNLGRYVPVQILQSAIKYGKGIPDPQGTKAIMYYTVMYKTESKVLNGVTINYQQAYNLEVLYQKSKNLVLHFLYTRDPLPKGGLPGIPRAK